MGKRWGRGRRGLDRQGSDGGSVVWKLRLRLEFSHLADGLHVALRQGRLVVDEHRRADGQPQRFRPL